MRKLILSIALLIIVGVAYAQKADSTAKKSTINGNNELRINLPYAIAGIPEINYERIINEDMSVGLAVLVGIEKNTDYKFGFIPNYRVYFGGKKANGFFIEGNMAVVSSRSENNSYTYDSGTNIYVYHSKVDDQTSFGLGAAAGAKFLTRNGFVGEIYLGAGRLFGSNNVGGYPRVGITIGKRF